MFDCIWEFWLGNRSLTRDICPSDHNSFCGNCTLTCGVFPVTLLPLGKQDTTSQQFRPPSFQDKAAFRQALSKFSPHFHKKSPFTNFIFKNPCMFHSYLTIFSKLSPKNNPLWQIQLLTFPKGHFRIPQRQVLHSQPEPLERHPYTCTGILLSHISNTLRLHISTSFLCQLRQSCINHFRPFLTSTHIET